MPSGHPGRVEICSPYQKSLLIQSVEYQFGGKAAAVLLLPGDQAAIANGERFVRASAEVGCTLDSSGLALDSVII